MSDMNKVILMGRLARDPELKVTPGGTSICRFSVCTSKTWKDKDGNKQQKPMFHNVVAFDKKAEVIDRYFRKGNGIWIDGEIEYREYEKDGVKKWVTEIKLNDLGFVGGDRKEGDSAKPKDETTKINGGFDDDIPF